RGQKRASDPWSWSPRQLWSTQDLRGGRCHPYSRQALEMRSSVRSFETRAAYFLVTQHSRLSSAMKGVKPPKTPGNSCNGDPCLPKAAFGLTSFPLPKSRYSQGKTSLFGREFPLL
ncbi:mCG145065, partial [Mus musculus]